jgi:hypothetical protein
MGIPDGAKKYACRWRRAARQWWPQFLRRALNYFGVVFAQALDHQLDAGFGSVSLPRRT